jgi:hypothetical protein
MLTVAAFLFDRTAVGAVQGVTSQTLALGCFSVASTLQPVILRVGSSQLDFQMRIHSLTEAVIQTEAYEICNQNGDLEHAPIVFALIY